MEFERHKGKEVLRYDNAQQHLSDFDRELTRGHFDKGKLNQAIDDVKNLVDHNTLSPELRDTLTADLRDLRVMRAEHGR
jgi:mRNA-degrading endonuclease YafQ of YafQ-DinJ toxin-antitoxin module